MTAVLQLLYCNGVRMTGRHVKLSRYQKEKISGAESNNLNGIVLCQMQVAKHVHKIFCTPVEHEVSVIFKI